MTEKKIPQRLKNLGKEINYCKRRLEKSRRTGRKIKFLDDMIEILSQQVSFLEKGPDPAKDSAPRGDHEDMRMKLIAAGFANILREQCEIFAREREELICHLREGDDFSRKMKILEREKEIFFRGLTSSQSRRLRRDYDAFTDMENAWITASEDCTYIDEGIRFLQRALEYLSSCRNFCLSIFHCHNFTLETRVPENFIGFFDISDIRRTIEIAQGAERNIVCAQREFVCVAGFVEFLKQFQPVLIPFLSAILRDANISGKIEETRNTIDGFIRGNNKLLEDIKARGERHCENLEKIERSRFTTYSCFFSGE